MTFDELKEMVKKDISLDETQLERESARTPQIHNKYLLFFMEEKLCLSRIESELNVLKKKKWLYYNGNMSQDELDENGWEQYDLRILRGDIDRLIESARSILGMLTCWAKYATVGALPISNRKKLLLK